MPIAGLPTGSADPTTDTSTAVPSGPATKSRRVRRLSGRDKLVLGLMVGIPVLIEAVLIWIPTLLSVGLSFTKWNGLQISDIRSNGLNNYRYVFTEYPPFWPAIRHNILWLLVLALVATPLGLLIAVLLDQQIRGSRIYQTVFFVP